MKTDSLFWSILIVAFIINLSLPQTSYSQSDKDRQEATMFVYNCGFGGITAGVGAVINKRKQEHILPTFWRGFKYGALGGLINYGSKRIDYLITKYTDYPYICPNTNTSNDAALLWAWPVRIVHSVGTSIIENAAANKPNVFQDYNMPIGFVNLSVSIKNKIVVKPQLMPFSFGTFLSVLFNLTTLNNSSCLNEKSTFKLKESLLLGTPYFSVNSLPINSNVNYNRANYNGGLNVYGTILADSYYDNSNFAGHIKAHELIHSLQDEDYLVFNQYLNKPYNRIIHRNKKVIKVLERYIHPDIPYFDAFYITMPKGEDEFTNFYEREAEHFSTNRYVSP